MTKSDGSCQNYFNKEEKSCTYIRKYVKYNGNPQANKISNVKFVDNDVNFSRKDLNTCNALQKDYYGNTGHIQRNNPG